MNLPRLALVLIATTLAAPAQTSNSNRVPAFGMALSPEDTKALSDGVESLGAELTRAKERLSPTAPEREFLPDVEIFHKAVHWALTYQEIYRTNEIPAAHRLIDQGSDRARQLAAGKRPWTTATGLVVRAYRSRIDRSIQPYGLVVPPRFATDTDHKYRLDVWLHGRDNNLTELKFLTDRQRSYGEFAPTDTFVLHPYGRYCNAFKFAGEIDVMEALAHVRKHYPIDERRITIRGFSMGGAGVWHLASHYPSFWVAAAPGAGFAETAQFSRIFQRTPQPTWYDQKLWHLYDATDYAANFFNCPVIAYSGEIDRQRQAAEIMAKSMEREGLKLTHLIGPKTEHRYEPQTKLELDRQFTALVNSAQRASHPERLRFTTYTTRYNSNNWITVDSLQRHWERADVDASIAKGSAEIRISTTNVSGLTIMLPRDVRTSPVKVTIDNTTLSAPANTSRELHLEKSGKRWKIVSAGSRELRKRHDLQGPIDDAFMDSFIMVRPTGKPLNAQAAAWIEDEFAHATNEWRSQFRGDAVVKSDTEITDHDVAQNHLILWGDPQSNKVLRRIAGKLPLRWRSSDIRLGDKSFAGDKFIPVLIFPNPLNPSRYVVLNSGFTFCEAGRSSNALQIPKLPDYAVLDMTVPRTSRYPTGVALVGFFDDEWKITASPQ